MIRKLRWASQGAALMWLHEQAGRGAQFKVADDPAPGGRPVIEAWGALGLRVLACMDYLGAILLYDKSIRPIPVGLTYEYWHNPPRGEAWPYRLQKARRKTSAVA